MHKKPIFYDTDCLSCFIMVNKIWILKKLFQKIIIPQDVYKEFKQPPGNNRIKEIKKLIKEGFIEVQAIEIKTKEWTHTNK